MTATAKKPAPAKAASPSVKAAKSAKPVVAEAKKRVAPTAKVVEPVAKGKGPAAKKGKANDKAAKPEASDVDLSDLESDLEGEPVPVEDVAKAKPLRMKVSRAKERALMREFGLDETQLTEEEVAKRRQELKTLIKMGKTRGFLTHQEINDHLPPDRRRRRDHRDGRRGRGSRGGRAFHRRLRVRSHDRPGAHVHARDGHGRAADA